jgi:Protein of unknown function (DUF1573)
MNRRNVILWTAAALAGSGLLVPLAGRAVRGPAAGSPGHASLAVDNPNRDLETVTPGDRVEIAYTLRNVGTGMLNVRDIQTSCGCAPAQLSSDAIGPGAGATITVSYHVPQAPGSYSHAILFKTSDPERADVALRFRCKAEWPVDISPPTLFLGAVPAGSEERREVELFSPGEIAFEVSAVACSAPWIRVEKLPGFSRYRCRYVVTVRPPGGSGEFAEAVQFKTDSPKRSLVSVPVTGEVVSQHRVSPKRILLGERPKGAVVETKLVIASPGDSDPVVREVAVRDDDWRVVSWQCRPMSNRRMLLSIGLRVPEDLGYRRSVVYVRGGAELGALEVPVSCLVVGSEAAAPVRAGDGAMTVSVGGK